MENKENIKKLNTPTKEENIQENNPNEEFKSVQFKKSSAERKEKIARIIRELGLWNINKSKLAREMGVSHAQIARDIKYLIKKIPKNEIIESRKEILESFKKSMQECRKLLFDATGETKLKAIDRIIMIGKALTDAYESYGLKEKVAEKYTVDTTLRSYDRLREILDKIERKKNENKHR